MSKIRQLALCLILSLTLAPALSSAREPANLTVYKQQLMRYHDSGQYLYDINAVVSEAISYLKWRLQHPEPGKKPAIVLDIDETSLSNYADMVRLGFGGTLEEIRQDEDKGIDPAIEPTLKLYRFAKAHHIAVFFITGRYEYERQNTIDNLQKAGYHDWNGLILRSPEYQKKPAAVYKTAMRKQLVEQGYDILLNLGDQKSDFAGGYADKTFKLPNPYYLIP